MQTREGNGNIRYVNVPTAQTNRTKRRAEERKKARAERKARIHERMAQNPRLVRM